MKISEKERKRRVEFMLANAVICGPDHPIYQSGLRITLVPKLKKPK